MWEDAIYRLLNSTFNWIFCFRFYTFKVWVTKCHFWSNTNVIIKKARFRDRGNNINCVINMTFKLKKHMLRFGSFKNNLFTEKGNWKLSPPKVIRIFLPKLNFEVICLCPCEFAEKITVLFWVAQREKCVPFLRLTADASLLFEKYHNYC
jgi:hypothetical protein